MGFEEFLGINPWTALFTLANTITLFLVLKKYLFKPVMKMIANRQGEIDNMYRKASDSRKEAEALQKLYEEKFAAATTEADRIVKEAIIRGQSREEALLRKADLDAQAIRQKAFADIEREKKKAVTEAMSSLTDIAMEIAGKVVGESLKEDDQSALVEQFIRQLGDSQ